MQLTWHEASATLKTGDRIRFVEPFDIFPEILIPAGTMATVTENGLNELGRQLIVKADDENITCALAEWDGEIWLAPPLDETTGNREPDWQDFSPIASAD